MDDLVSPVGPIVMASSQARKVTPGEWTRLAQSPPAGK